MYEVSITLHEHRSHGNVLTRHFETMPEAMAAARTLVDTGLARDASVTKGRVMDERGNALQRRYATLKLTQDADGNVQSREHCVEVVYP